MNQDKIIIHSDGGARGNPGPGACAYVVEIGDKIIFKGSKSLGKVTNNIAEYHGVVEALRWLTENKNLVDSSLGPVEFYMDSELIVKQINGEYRVKNIDLKRLFLEVSNLIGGIGRKILFRNVARSKNKVADFLVNTELDRNSN